MAIDLNKIKLSICVDEAFQLLDKMNIKTDLLQHVKIDNSKQDKDNLDAVGACECVFEKRAGFKVSSIKIFDTLIENESPIHVVGTIIHELGHWIHFMYFEVEPESEEQYTKETEYFADCFEEYVVAGMPLDFKLEEHIDIIIKLGKIGMLKNRNGIKDYLMKFEKYQF